MTDLQSTAAQTFSPSPTSSATSTPASLAVNSSSNSAPVTSGGNPDLHTQATLTEQDRAGISVGVPVSVIAIAVIATLIIFQRRRQGRQKVSSERGSLNAGDESQPYLQQKAELEAQEKHQLELEARERRHELDGELNIVEAPNQVSSHEIANEDP